jgi:hypothetical protein
VKTLLQCLCIAAVVLLAATAAPAAQYVVDQQNPAASDQNAGTWDKPWKTVQHAADAVQAGDVVCVMEGVYDEAVTLKTSGTAQAPIVFRGLPRQKAQVKGFVCGKTSWVRIEGCRFVDEGVTVGGDHVEVLDNYFHEVRHQAVSGTATNIRAAYNRAYAPSAGFAATGQNWLVEANEVERMIYKTVECDNARFFGKGHVFARNYFHGTAQAEVASSHVDGFQTWHRQGKDAETAHEMQFLDNFVLNFHQGIIARSPEVGALSKYTIRGNVFAHGLLPNEKGAAVGLIFENVPDVTVEHNLIADVQWYAFSPSGATSGVLRDNLVYKVGSFDRGKRPDGFKVERNMAFECKTELPAEAAAQKDPLFVDPSKDNWRLRPESPAIKAGTDGSALGPFAVPAVYVVDVNHPGASDEAAVGHPGRPFKTLTHALNVAKAGETIVIYGGIYRECPVAKADDVTVRAAAGQRVIITGADLVEPWQRDGNGWTAAMKAAPKDLRCNGQPAAKAAYDAAAGKLRVQGEDPRLSVYEVAVRPVGLDLAGKKVRVEGLVEIAAEKPVANGEKATIATGKP